LVSHAPIAPADRRALGAPLAENDSAPGWVKGPSSGPPPAIDPAFGSDPATGYSVVFGGYRNTTPPCLPATACPSGGTWALRNGTWKNATPAALTSSNSPSARFGAAMAYDPDLSAFVLFGGANGMASGLNNPALGDTWLYFPSNQTWTQTCRTCTSGTDSPPARWDAGVAYDPVARTVVVFGGSATTSGSEHQRSDTWSFNGTAWRNLTALLSPAARSSPSMAWDGQTQSIILFGGFPVGSTTDKTWSFTSGNWSLLTPSASPAPRAGASAVTDPVNGSVTIFGGCTTDPCSTAPINESWSFSGGTWYQLMPNPHPAPSGRDHEAVLEIDDPEANVVFGGDVNGAPANDTWSWYHLEAQVTTASTTALDIGQSVRLSDVASGGPDALTFTWLGLPAGCTSANASSIQCTATGSQAFGASIRARVTDGIGLAVDAPAVVLLYTPPPVVMVTADPTSGIVPLSVTFLASATGGSGTISYGWEFGDHGVATGPNPTHRYTVAGSYNVTVWANDSLRVSAHASIRVDAVGLLGLDLVISPVSFVSGSSSEIVATGYGGVAPYTYTFLGLPVGCEMRTSNESTCTISSPGNYSFSVTVTDQSGQQARKNATLDVSAAPSHHLASSPPNYELEYLTGAGIAVGLAVGLLVLYLFRSRRRPPPPRPQTTVPVPEPHEVPALGGTLYVPPPPRPQKR
jgi:hypothetical protein